MVDFTETLSSGDTSITQEQLAWQTVNPITTSGTQIAMTKYTLPTNEVGTLLYQVDVHGLTPANLFCSSSTANQISFDDPQVDDSYLLGQLVMNPITSNLTQVFVTTSTVPPFALQLSYKGLVGGTTPTGVSCGQDSGPCVEFT